MWPETVRKESIVLGDRSLTVSTIKIDHRRYDTVVFDDSSDGRHNGKRVGKWIIDSLNIGASTRDEAMDNHRDALHAAHHLPITA